MTVLDCFVIVVLHRCVIIPLHLSGVLEVVRGNTVVSLSVMPSVTPLVSVWDRLWYVGVLSHLHLVLCHRQASDATLRLIAQLGFKLNTPPAFIILTCYTLGMYRCIGNVGNDVVSRCIRACNQPLALFSVSIFHILLINLRVEHCGV